VTPTATTTFPPNEFVNVTFDVPAATAVIVNGPVPEAGETVAAAVLLDVAVNEPV
jgi:hypothetical protein